MNVDFHLHSLASDGSHSSEVLIRIAKEKGINILSLTDHDTTLGLSEARKTAKKLGMTFIDGVEIQADINEQYYEHILAYSIKDYNKMNSFLERVRDERMQFIINYIEQLRSMGCSIDLESVDNLTPGRHLTIRHITKWINNTTPFSEIKKHYNHHILPTYHYCEEVIQLIKECGSIAVWAHPFRYNSEFYYAPEKLDSHVQMLKDIGLDGIEAYYGAHDQKQISICETIAEKYGLIKTGGSDWHGWSDHSPMGVEIPNKDVEIFLNLV